LPKENEPKERAAVHSPLRCWFRVNRGTFLHSFKKDERCETRPPEADSNSPRAYPSFL